MCVVLTKVSDRRNGAVGHAPGFARDHGAAGKSFGVGAGSSSICAPQRHGPRRTSAARRSASRKWAAISSKQQQAGGPGRATATPARGMGEARSTTSTAFLLARGNPRGRPAGSRSRWAEPRESLRCGPQGPVGAGGSAHRACGFRWPRAGAQAGPRRSTRGHFRRSQVSISARPLAS